MTPAELARLIDHTLLDPLATPGQVAMFLADAAGLGVAAVCLSPSRLPIPEGAVPATTAVAAVVGFPSGAHQPEVKALEAARALEAGASELDLVVDLGLAKAGLWLQLEAEVAAVRHACPDALLKVIIEAAALPGDVAVVSACHAAVAAGADMVKTSTGFHPAGGATLHHVELMAGAVGPGIGVKAAGGIRDATTALAMLDAGATRLGCSATRAVLEGLPS